MGLIIYAESFPGQDRKACQAVFLTALTHHIKSEPLTRPQHIPKLIGRTILINEFLPA